MNWKVEIDKPKEISRRIADFLHEQAGAETATVKTFSYGNLLAIFVIPYALPDEAKNRQLSRLTLGVLSRIDLQMIRNICEETTGSKVVNLFWIAEQEGRHLLIASLSRDLPRQTAEGAAAQPRDAKSGESAGISFCELCAEALHDEGLWLALNAEYQGATVWPEGAAPRMTMAETNHTEPVATNKEDESWRHDAAVAMN